MFICFQKSIQQFIDIQNNLGHNDKLNEYITHRGSASFLVLPGKREVISVKHSLIKISIITLLIIITRLFSLTSVSVANDSQLNDAYVAISDAKSTLEHKQLNYNEKQNVLNEVKHKIMSLNIKENKKEKMLNRNFICLIKQRLQINKSTRYQS